jgi:hypothetical protein
LVINKFPNKEVYEKIKEKGSLGADDVNVLEDYPGLEWKGEYSSTATYVKGDIVYYENMLYVMVSASVIGAIPGIDNDWIDFAKRSVTSSDVTNALGFTPADSTKVLPLSGGTLTGNLTGKYIIGTWLQATEAGHLATTPTRIPVFDDKGWIYYRTPAEILKDIGASSGYTLTEADKAEIADMVDGATIVQAPKYVSTVEEMTDTSRPYVLASTGHIWAYMNTTTEHEVTKRDNIIGTTDNPYQTGRLSSSGSVSADIQTHTLTPYIDLTKAEYQGKTIQIHLEGNRYASENNETYIMYGSYKSDKTVIVGRGFTSLVNGIYTDYDNNGQIINLEILGNTSAVLTIGVPLTSDTGPTTVGFLRFCGLGLVTDSVYITYPDIETVTGGQWYDTG